MSWRATAPDLELMVACGGAHHRIVWSQGAVVLTDHPDLASERALMALGGTEPPCLAQLRLWHDAVADGGFLAEWIDENHLTDARLSWLGTALERMRLEGFHEFLRHLPPARAERMGHFVHRFPRPWIDRAACEVSEALDHPTSDDPGNGSGNDPANGRDGVHRCRYAAGLIEQAVANRLRRAFVDSIGGNQLSWGAAALVPLHITVAANGVPSVVGRLTGPARGVQLTVRPTWLHQVWGAGAPLIDGSLVLALDVPGQAEARAALAVWRSTPGGTNTGVEVVWRQVTYSSGRWRVVSN